MREVFPALFVGTVDELPSGWPSVNLSSIYHYQHQGWTRKRTEHHKDDPTYMILLEPDLLSVNWVDGDADHFNYQNNGCAVVDCVLDFLQAHEQDKKIIVCDQGLSRSPSMALTFLAKRLHTIPDSSFAMAREVYTRDLDPTYAPNPGIVTFLTDKWKLIA